MSMKHRLTKLEQHKPPVDVAQRILDHRAAIANGTFTPTPLPEGAAHQPAWTMDRRIADARRRVGWA